MIKTCQRCENEARTPGLPIGPLCVEQLRNELSLYDALLDRPEHERLLDAEAVLEAKIAPLTAELTLVQARLGEIDAEQRAADEAAEAELEAAKKAEADAEAEEAIAKLEAEIESAKAELAVQTAQDAVDADLDDRVASALEAAKVETEIARLEADLAVEREKLEVEDR